MIVFSNGRSVFVDFLKNGSKRFISSAIGGIIRSVVDILFQELKIKNEELKITNDEMQIKNACCYIDQWTIFSA